MSKTVVLDCDGCLLNFVSAYVNFVQARGLPHVQESGIRSYFFLADFGVPADHSKELFRAFVDAAHFAGLEPYPGASALTKGLKGAGYRIVLATDVPTRAQAHRVANLLDKGIVYDEIVFGPHKHEVAKRERAVLVLEDNPGHIESVLRETPAIVAAPRWVYNEHLMCGNDRVIDLGSTDNALIKLHKGIATGWQK